MRDYNKILTQLNEDSEICLAAMRWYATNDCDASLFDTAIAHYNKIINKIAYYKTKIKQKGEL